MSEFKNRNKKLAQTMDSHLIDIDTFGIWDDDFDRFFEKRCAKISEELGKRIIPQAIDKRHQRVELNDVEEVGV